jgi:hypothetical protein
MNPDENTIQMTITGGPGSGDATIEIRTGMDIAPNELNEYYDAFLLIHDKLPEDTHPLWKIAVEAVAIGGEGLAPGVDGYSRQQIDKNNHRAWEYRFQFGKTDEDIDFPHLKQFHNIPTKPPNPEDQSLFDTEIEIPVAPKSKKVLPLKVDEDEISDAISLLNEFPEEPLSNGSGGTESNLLNAKMFPGLSLSDPDQLASSDIDNVRV